MKSFSRSLFILPVLFLTLVALYTAGCGGFWFGGTGDDPVGPGTSSPSKMLEISGVVSDGATAAAAPSAEKTTGMAPDHAASRTIELDALRHNMDVIDCASGISVGTATFGPGGAFTARVDILKHAGKNVMIAVTSKNFKSVMLYKRFLGRMPGLTELPDTSLFDLVKISNVNVTNETTSKALFATEKEINKNSTHLFFAFATSEIQADRKISIVHSNDNAIERTIESQSGGAVNIAQVGEAVKAINILASSIISDGIKSGLFNGRIESASDALDVFARIMGLKISNQSVSNVVTQNSVPVMLKLENAGGALTIDSTSVKPQIAEFIKNMDAIKIVEAPVFNIKGGEYTGAQTVSLSTPTPGAVIFYTLDGSVPDETAGIKYDLPFVISKDTVVKATAVKIGMIASPAAYLRLTILKETIVADRFDVSKIEGDIMAGTTVNVQITAKDKSSNTVKNFNSTATLSDQSATITPTSISGFINGEWSGEVVMTKSTAANKIRVVSGNVSGESLSFNIVPGSPAAVAMSIQPSAAAISGESFSAQPSVKIQDAYGNDVKTSEITVTASLKSGAAGTLAGTLAAKTNAEGIAAFLDLGYNGTGDIYLEFNAAGLTKAQSDKITVSPSSAVPTALATAGSFTDTDLDANKIAGNITWTAASPADQVTGYKIYWGENATTKLSGNAAVVYTAADASTATQAVAAGTTLPAGATHFLIYSYNANGESASCLAVLIIDEVLQSAAPTVLPTYGSFTDGDLNASRISGNISWIAADPVTGISGYRIFWGQNATTKLSGNTAVVYTVAGAATEKQAVAANTALPAGATHFLIYSYNSAGESASCLAVAIIDAVSAPALANGLSFARNAGMGGQTVITLGAPSVAGNTFRYLVSADANAVPTPLVGSGAASWTAIANGGIINAENGKHIGVAEVDVSNKVVQFSDATSVADALAPIPDGTYAIVSAAPTNGAADIHFDGTTIRIGAASGTPVSRTVAETTNFSKFTGIIGVNGAGDGKLLTGDKITVTNGEITAVEVAGINITAERAIALGNNIKSTATLVIAGDTDSTNRITVTGTTNGAVTITGGIVDVSDPNLTGAVSYNTAAAATILTGTKSVTAGAAVAANPLAIGSSGGSVSVDAAATAVTVSIDEACTVTINGMVITPGSAAAIKVNGADALSAAGGATGYSLNNITSNAKTFNFTGATPQTGPISARSSEAANGLTITGAAAESGCEITVFGGKVDAGSNNLTGAIYARTADSTIVAGAKPVTTTGAFTFNVTGTGLITVGSGGTAIVQGVTFVSAADTDTIQNTSGTLVSVRGGAAVVAGTAAASKLTITGAAPSLITNNRDGLEIDLAAFNGVSINASAATTFNVAGMAAYNSASITPAASLTFTFKITDAVTPVINGQAALNNTNNLTYTASAGTVGGAAAGSFTVISGAQFNLTASGYGPFPDGTYTISATPDNAAGKINSDGAGTITIGTGGSTTTHNSGNTVDFAKLDAVIGANGAGAGKLRTGDKITVTNGEITAVEIAGGNTVSARTIALGTNIKSTAALVIAGDANSGNTITVTGTTSGAIEVKGGKVDVTDANLSGAVTINANSTATIISGAKTVAVGATAAASAVFINAAAGGRVSIDAAANAVTINGVKVDPSATATVSVTDANTISADGGGTNYTIEAASETNAKTFNFITSAQTGTITAKSSESANGLVITAATDGSTGIITVTGGRVDVKDAKLTGTVTFNTAATATILSGSKTVNVNSGAGSSAVGIIADGGSVNVDANATNVNVNVAASKTVTVNGIKVVPGADTSIIVNNANKISVAGSGTAYSIEADSASATKTFNITSAQTGHITAKAGESANVLALTADAASNCAITITGGKVDLSDANLTAATIGATTANSTIISGSRGVLTAGAFTFNVTGTGLVTVGNGGTAIVKGVTLVSAADTDTIRNTSGNLVSVRGGAVSVAADAAAAGLNLTGAAPSLITNNKAGLEIDIASFSAVPITASVDTTINAASLAAAGTAGITPSAGNPVFTFRINSSVKPAISGLTAFDNTNGLTYTASAGTVGGADYGLFTVGSGAPFTLTVAAFSSIPDGTYTIASAAPTTDTAALHYDGTTIKIGAASGTPASYTASNTNNFAKFAAVIGTNGLTDANKLGTGDRITVSSGEITAVEVAGINITSDRILALGNNIKSDATLAIAGDTDSSNKLTVTGTTVGAIEIKGGIVDVSDATLSGTVKFDTNSTATITSGAKAVTVGATAADKAVGITATGGSVTVNALATAVSINGIKVAPSAIATVNVTDANTLSAVGGGTNYTIDAATGTNAKTFSFITSAQTGTITAKSSESTNGLTITSVAAASNGAIEIKGGKVDVSAENLTGAISYNTNAAATILSGAKNVTVGATAAASAVGITATGGSVTVDAAATNVNVSVVSAKTVTINGIAVNPDATSIVKVNGVDSLSADGGSTNYVFDAVTTARKTFNFTGTAQTGTISAKASELTNGLVITAATDGSTGNITVAGGRVDVKDPNLKGTLNFNTNTAATILSGAKAVTVGALAAANAVGITATGGSVSVNALATAVSINGIKVTPSATATVNVTDANTLSAVGGGTNYTIDAATGTNAKTFSFITSAQTGTITAKASESTNGLTITSATAASNGAIEITGGKVDVTDVNLSGTVTFNTNSTATILSGSKNVTVGATAAASAVGITATGGAVTVDASATNVSVSVAATKTVTVNGIKVSPGADISIAVNNADKISVAGSGAAYTIEADSALAAKTLNFSSAQSGTITAKASESTRGLTISADSDSSGNIRIIGGRVDVTDAEIKGAITADTANSTIVAGAKAVATTGAFTFNVTGTGLITVGNLGTAVVQGVTLVSASNTDTIQNTSDNLVSVRGGEVTIAAGAAATKVTITGAQPSKITNNKGNIEIDLNGYSAVPLYAYVNTTVNVSKLGSGKIANITPANIGLTFTFKIIGFTPSIVGQVATDSTVMWKYTASAGTTLGGAAAGLFTAAKDAPFTLTVNGLNDFPDGTYTISSSSPAIGETGKIHNNGSGTITIGTAGAPISCNSSKNNFAKFDAVIGTDGAIGTNKLGTGDIITVTDGSITAVVVNGINITSDRTLTLLENIENTATLNIAGDTNSTNKLTVNGTTNGAITITGGIVDVVDTNLSGAVTYNTAAAATILSGAKTVNVGATAAANQVEITATGGGVNVNPAATNVYVSVAANSTVIMNGISVCPNAGKSIQVVDANTLLAAGTGTDFTINANTDSNAKTFNFIGSAPGKITAKASESTNGLAITSSTAASNGVIEITGGKVDVSGANLTGTVTYNTNVPATILSGAKTVNVGATAAGNAVGITATNGGSVSVTDASAVTVNVADGSTVTINGIAVKPEGAQAAVKVNGANELSAAGGGTNYTIDASTGSYAKMFNFITSAPGIITAKSTGMVNGLTITSASGSSGNITITGGKVDVSGITSSGTVTYDTAATATISSGANNVTVGATAASSAVGITATGGSVTVNALATAVTINGFKVTPSSTATVNVTGANTLSAVGGGTNYTIEAATGENAKTFNFITSAPGTITAKSSESTNGLIITAVSGSSGNIEITGGKVDVKDTNFVGTVTYNTAAPATILSGRKYVIVDSTAAANPVGITATADGGVSIDAAANSVTINGIKVDPSVTTSVTVNGDHELCAAGRDNTITIEASTEANEKKFIFTTEQMGDVRAKASDLANGLTITAAMDIIGDTVIIGGKVNVSDAKMHGSVRYNTALPAKIISGSKTVFVNSGAGDSPVGITAANNGMVFVNEAATNVSVDVAAGSMVKINGISVTPSAPKTVLVKGPDLLWAEGGDAAFTIKNYTDASYSSVSKTFNFTSPQIGPITAGSTLISKKMTITAPSGSSGTITINGGQVDVSDGDLSGTISYDTALEAKIISGAKAVTVGGTAAGNPVAITAANGGGVSIDAAASAVTINGIKVDPSATATITVTGDNTLSAAGGATSFTTVYNTTTITKTFNFTGGEQTGPVTASSLSDTNGGLIITAETDSGCTITITSGLVDVSNPKLTGPVIGNISANARIFSGSKTVSCPTVNNPAEINAANGGSVTSSSSYVNVKVAADETVTVNGIAIKPSAAKTINVIDADQVSVPGSADTYSLDNITSTSKTFKFTSAQSGAITSAKSLDSNGGLTITAISNSSCPVTVTGGKVDVSDTNLSVSTINANTAGSTIIAGSKAVTTAGAYTFIVTGTGLVTVGSLGTAIVNGVSLVSATGTNTIQNTSGSLVSVRGGAVSVASDAVATRLTLALAAPSSITNAKNGLEIDLGNFNAVPITASAATTVNVNGLAAGNTANITPTGSQTVTFKTTAGITPAISGLSAFDNNVSYTASAGTVGGAASGLFTVTHNAQFTLAKSAFSSIPNGTYTVSAAAASFVGSIHNNGLGTITIGIPASQTTHTFFNTNNFTKFDNVIGTNGEITANKLGAGDKITVSGGEITAVEVAGINITSDRTLTLGTNINSGATLLIAGDTNSTHKITVTGTSSGGIRITGGIVDVSNTNLSGDVAYETAAPATIFSGSKKLSVAYAAAENAINITAATGGSVNINWAANMVTINGIKVDLVTSISNAWVIVNGDHELSTVGSDASFKIDAIASGTNTKTFSFINSPQTGFIKAGSGDFENGLVIMAPSGSYGDIMVTGGKVDVSDPDLTAATIYATTASSTIFAGLKAVITEGAYTFGITGTGLVTVNSGGTAIVNGVTLHEAFERSTIQSASAELVSVGGTGSEVSVASNSSVSKLTITGYAPVSITNAKPGLEIDLGSFSAVPITAAANTTVNISNLAVNNTAKITPDPSGSNKTITFKIAGGVTPVTGDLTAYDATNNFSYQAAAGTVGGAAPGSFTVTGGAQFTLTKLTCAPIPNGTYTVSATASSASGKIHNNGSGTIKIGTGTGQNSYTAPATTGFDKFAGVIGANGEGDGKLWTGDKITVTGGEIAAVEAVDRDITSDRALALGSNVKSTATLLIDGDSSNKLTVTGTTGGAITITGGGIVDVGDTNLTGAVTYNTALATDITTGVKNVTIGPNAITATGYVRVRSGGGVVSVDPAAASGSDVRIYVAGTKTATVNGINVTPSTEKQVKVNGADKISVWGGASSFVFNANTGGAPKTIDIISSAQTGKITARSSEIANGLIITAAVACAPEIEVTGGKVVVSDANLTTTAITYNSAGETDIYAGVKNITIGPNASAPAGKFIRARSDGATVSVDPAAAAAGDVRINVTEANTVTVNDIKVTQTGSSYKVVQVNGAHEVSVWGGTANFSFDAATDTNAKKVNFISDTSTPQTGTITAKSSELVNGLMITAAVASSNGAITVTGGRVDVSDPELTGPITHNIGVAATISSGTKAVSVGAAVLTSTSTIIATGGTVSVDDGAGAVTINGIKVNPNALTTITVNNANALSAPGGATSYTFNANTASAVKTFNFTTSAQTGAITSAKASETTNGLTLTAAAASNCAITVTGGKVDVSNANLTSAISAAITSDSKIIAGSKSLTVTNVDADITLALAGAQTGNISVTGPTNTTGKVVITGAKTGNLSVTGSAKVEVGDGATTAGSISGTTTINNASAVVTVKGAGGAGTLTGAMTLTAGTLDMGAAGASTGAVSATLTDGTLKTGPDVSLAGITVQDGTATKNIETGKAIPINITGVTTATRAVAIKAAAAISTDLPVTQSTNATATFSNIYVPNFATPPGCGIANWKIGSSAATGSSTKYSVTSGSAAIKLNPIASGVTVTLTKIVPEWFALGSGTNYYVDQLATDENGNLYASGIFTTAGGAPAQRIARWNGTTSSWSALGSGISGGQATVYSMVPDGNGNLYAGGAFLYAGGVTVNRIAKWNGSSWSALGAGGMDDTVWSMALDGSGNLYASGPFRQAGAINAYHIAKWNGSSWSVPPLTGENIKTLAIDGSGNIFAGGSLGMVYVSYNVYDYVYLKKLDGSDDGLVLGHGVAQDEFNRLAIDGSNIYAGGYFTEVNGVQASNVAKWNGSSWSALGGGVGYGLNSLATDGIGNVYASGFTWLSKWNGSTWTEIGGTRDANIYSMTIDKTRRIIYMGGEFTNVNGVTVNRIARWYY